MTHLELIFIYRIVVVCWGSFFHIRISNWCGIICWKIYLLSASITLISCKTFHLLSIFLTFFFFGIFKFLLILKSLWCFSDLCLFLYQYLTTFPFVHLVVFIFLYFILKYNWLAQCVSCTYAAKWFSYSIQASFVF